jgi:putative heme-binding domain-containing protein
MERLMQAIARGAVAATDVDAVSLQAMRSVAKGDLAQQVIDRFGPAPGADRAEVVRHALDQWPNRSSASSTREGADTSRGKLAYEKHCAVCHEPRQVGGKTDVALGPALGGLVHWTNEAWLTAILDPNRGVDDKYRAFQAMTEDGEIITGLKLREDETSIEWVNALGRVESTPKSSLTNVQSTARSLMPEGFEQLLSTEEIASIISYLRSKQER